MASEIAERAAGEPPVAQIRITLLLAFLLGTLANSHAAFADWSASASDDRTRVNTNSKALDGRTMLYVSCNKLLGPGLVTGA
jgi:hypothetical protein